MEIRKAVKDDIDSIAEIYEKVHDAEEGGEVFTGWLRGIYPTRKTVEDALNRDDMFVIEDEGNVAAAAIINQLQVDVYKNVPWRHCVKDDEVMVLHTLAVDTSKYNKGYGRRFVAFYEEYARAHGCTELRMDTNVINTKARRLYNKLGYEEMGIEENTFNGIPNVRLVCLEKYLAKTDSCWEDGGGAAG